MNQFFSSLFHIDQKEKLEREKKEKEEILMKSFKEEYQKDSN